MKKLNLFAVSLIAVMTAGAANAKIASTDYVDGKTGVLTNLETTNKDTLVGAINEVKSSAAADLESSIEAAKTAAAATAQEKVDALANGAVKTNTNMITTLNGADTVTGSVANKIKAATSDMQIKSNMAKAATALTTDKASDTKYTSVAAAEAIAKAAADAVAGDLTTLQGTVAGHTTTLNKLEGEASVAGSIKNQIEAAKTAAAADATTKVNALKDGAVADNAAAIKAMDTAYKAADTVLDGKISTNTSNITALQTGKQDKLTTTNFIGDGAVKVNIAADGKITVSADEYDDTALAGRVTTAEGKITTAEGKIKALEDTGVTAEKIIQITTNKDNIAAVKATADAALPSATYTSQVGTVNANNMGTTASTVVTAIKEVATEAAAADGKAVAAQNTANSAVTAAEAAQNTANAAIPQPSAADKCTTEADGCALLYKDGKYIWESVGR